VTGVKFNGFFIQTLPHSGRRRQLVRRHLRVSERDAGGDKRHAVRVAGTVQEPGPPPDPISPPLTGLAGNPSVPISTGRPAAARDDRGGDDAAIRIARFRAFEGCACTSRISRSWLPRGTERAECDVHRTASSSASSTGVRACSVVGPIRPIRRRQARPPSSGSCEHRASARDSDGLTVAEADVTSGAHLTNRSALDYSFRTTILPIRVAAGVIGTISAIPVRAAPPNEFTVASFNMKRFFDTVNDPIDDVVLTWPRSSDG
jgi:hypothetical protein